MNVLTCKPQPSAEQMEQAVAAVERTPSSKTFLFTDLDDSLIQTERKLDPEQAVVTGALDRAGQPLSYFTRKQLTLLSLFIEGGATVVPVTGRNRDALERVCYPFESYRAVSHGAVVLAPDGELCPDWSDYLAEEGPQWAEQLRESQQQIDRYIRRQQLDARVNLIVDEAVCAYVSIKGMEPDLDQLQPLLQEAPLRLHRNGRNAALLPPYACKRKAVEHIMGQLEIGSDDLVLGLGDSLTDLPFMRLADFMLCPAQSQIESELR